MIECLPALRGGLDKNLEILLEIRLTRKILKASRTQRTIEFEIVFDGRGGGNVVGHGRISLVHEITITMMVFATWHGDSSLRSE
jgi:hypothetical protein